MMEVMIHLFYFPEQYFFFSGRRPFPMNVDLPRRQTGEELSNEEALERLLQEPFGRNPRKIPLESAVVILRICRQEDPHLKYGQQYGTK